MSIYGHRYYGDEREDFEQGYHDREDHHRDWDRDRWNDRDEAYFEGQRQAQHDEERRQEERRQEEDDEERRAHERYVEAQREEEEYLYQCQYAQDMENFAQQEPIEEQVPTEVKPNENF